jgi:hypothetical protein
MRARGLVADSHIKVAHLIEAPRARSILDVIQRSVLPNPRVGRAPNEVINRVRSHDRQFPVRSLDKRSTFRHRKLLPIRRDPTTHSRSFFSALSSVEVVPGVVGDVEGAAGGIDGQQVNSATGRGFGYLDADTVTAGFERPIGDAVCVDKAAEDADG